MGDKATLAKARKELEDLYVGVPDESVNLSFEHLAELKASHVGEEKKKPNMEAIDEVGYLKESLSMGKSHSLDFSKAIHAARPRQQHSVVDETHQHQHQHQHHHAPMRNMHTGLRNISVDNSLAFDDMSGMSVISRSTYHERGGRRRPGIPHSNICTICSTYIYMFRHRCLVCGRVYCRNCVGLGMGDMTEGRKCTECLGRKFSERYIQNAGDLGCCGLGFFKKYPSMVKQQELKWAEKGPRRSRERDGHGRNGVVSRSRSPMTPRTPTRAQVSSSPNSFVMSAQFPPHSSPHPHIPY